MSRPGQVELSTLNCRVRQFNATFSRKLKDVHSAHCHCQLKTNLREYLVDGIHLNIDSMDKCCRGIKEAVLKHYVLFEHIVHDIGTETCIGNWPHGDFRFKWFIDVYLHFISA